MDPDTLLKEHAALIGGIAKRYAGRGLPLEDLRQEAMLGIIDAASRYVPTHGTQFSTYATYWIKKRILAALEQETRCGASPLPGETDVQDTGADIPCGIDGSAIPAIDIQSANHYPPSASDIVLPASMPERERRVMELCYNRSLPLKDVAAELSISVERVKQLRAKALRRLKAHHVPVS